jgi:hypothetical protein
MVHYRLHKSPPLVCIQGQTNPVYAIPAYLLKNKIRNSQIVGFLTKLFKPINYYFEFLLQTSLT